MTAIRTALIGVVAFVVVALGLPGSVAVPSAATTTITVTSAVPSTGEQGTLGLDVVVGGKGFKSGAKAQFFKTGTTDPAGVNVKATKYVSSTQLVATVDIADAAAIAQFDIQVQNTDGRTGKGTELFSVTAKKTIEPIYVAEFVESKADDPAWSPKIRSDGGGAYLADIQWAGNSFHITARATENRAVLFQFDDPYPSYGASFACEAWGTHVPYNRSAGYPPYALSADKVAVPAQSDFTTTYELVYNETLDRWERVVESVTRRETTWKYLSMSGMARGQKAYAMLVIWFRFDGSLDTYYVNFNDTFDRELIPLDNGMLMNGGVVEVERDAVADAWYIRPISSRFPILGNPPSMIPQDQANHALYDVGDLKSDPGGNCDLGNFLMPFEIKVTRIR